MLFRNVVGQSEVKQKLIDMVQQNRLSHALLFLGKEGSGGLPLAMAFAEYVSLLPLKQETSPEASLFGAPVEMRLPASPDEADQWMEKQPSFSKADALVHPDIHFSYPVITKKSGTPPLSTDYSSEWREFIKKFPYGNVYDWLQFIGAENKQGNITAQECNDILRKLSLKSFESGYKILVMWMPEYLGKEGNKLLKLIEEPPADTLFILVAESEEQILSTILSRCHLVRVPAIDTVSVQQGLVQRAGTPAEQALQIANMARGNYREALQMLQHADEDFFNLLRDWLNAILKNQPIPQSKVIEELSRTGRENQKQFLRYFTHMVEQAVRFRVLDPSTQQTVLQALSPAEQDFVPKLNKAMTLEMQEALAQELDKAAYHIERNANARILFHALSIKIFHIARHGMVVSV